MHFSLAVSIGIILAAHIFGFDAGPWEIEAVELDNAAILAGISDVMKTPDETLNYSFHSENFLIPFWKSQNKKAAERVYKSLLRYFNRHRGFSPFIRN